METLIRLLLIAYSSNHSIEMSQSEKQDLELAILACSEMEKSVLYLNLKMLKNIYEYSFGDTLPQNTVAIMVDHEDSDGKSSKKALASKLIERVFKERKILEFLKVVDPNWEDNLWGDTVQEKEQGQGCVYHTKTVTKTWTKKSIIETVVGENWVEDLVTFTGYQAQYITIEITDEESIYLDVSYKPEVDSNQLELFEEESDLLDLIG